MIRANGIKPVGPVLQKGKLKSVFLMPVKKKNAGNTRYLFAYRNGERKDKKERLHIIRTLSVPQMITNEAVGSAIVEKTNQTILKRLTHELDREFGTLGTNLAGGGK